MDIVCCSDQGYLKYCITMLLSLFDHHRGEDIRVHLLANGLLPAEVEKVSDVVEAFEAKLEVYQVDGDFLSSLARGQQGYITPTTYARLFLSEILPAEIDKVIYLDCDLIVVDSLKPLWGLSVEETFDVAAVEDSCSANKEYYERLQLSTKHRYFNAGVLLINLSSWRKRGFVELALDVLKARASQLHYADQDVLNILCDGRTKYLPFRYNIQEPMLRRHMPEFRSDALGEVVDSISSPIVVHFTYKLKPWCYISFHPYKNHFYHYFDQTEWGGERPAPSWKERAKRFMWWSASMVNLVNTYYPLPIKMRMESWRKEHSPFVWCKRTWNN